MIENTSFRLLRLAKEGVALLDGRRHERSYNFGGEVQNIYGATRKKKASRMRDAFNTEASTE